MIHRHPDDNLLAEYSAGSIPWALGLGVAAHLHFCPECRNKTARLNQVGAAMLTHCQPRPVNSACFEQLMQKIERAEQQQPALQQSSPEPNIATYRGLPTVLQKLLPSDRPLRWKSVTRSLKMARLRTGQSRYEAAFMRIDRGGKVAEHGHGGLEVTLVLEGSFSDGEGVYLPGDFILRQPGEVHRPTAAQNQSCLCLVILEAPVRLTGLTGMIVNPFLKFKPG